MKLKRIIALILCAVLVTVGGVYATWQYAVSTNDIIIASDIGNPFLSEVNNISGGKLEVIKGSGQDEPKLVIDDTNNDKNGELVISGKVTVKFTPTNPNNVDPSLLEQDPIDSSYYVPVVVDYSIANHITFRGQHLFNLTTPTNNSLKLKLNPDNSGSYIAEIDSTIISKVLTLNPLSLPKYGDYTELLKSFTQTQPVLKMTVRHKNTPSTAVVPQPAA